MLPSLISICFRSPYKWISFSRVLSLSVYISYKVKKPSVLHLGNFMAFTYSFDSPYLTLFYSICLLRSSLVGLLLVLIIELFFRVTLVLFILSWNTFYKLRWSPMKSPRLCCPSSLWVCMYIWPIDLPARHLDFTIFFHLPMPNFIRASLRMWTSSVRHPGDRV